jgi:hypothetical protein
MKANGGVNAILVGLTVFSLNGAGQAAVIGTATLKANPPAVGFAAPDAALGAPWVSYVLRLQSTAGELIGGIDVDIFGSLHQRWDYDSSEGPFPTSSSLNQTNGDSHLMAQSFGFGGPTEDNPGTGSPLPNTATAYYGVGSHIGGTWGISSPQTSANLAYIVVPSNQLHLLDIEVNVANANGSIIGRLTERDFFPNVPEPASGVLLVVGILASTCARRRYFHRAS